MIERERPDALLPTLGGGTALDLARELSEDGTLRALRRRADRRRLRGDPARRGPRPVPHHDGAAPACACRAARAVNSMSEAERALPDIGLPAIVRPGLHDGRRRRRHRPHRGRVPPGRRRGPRGEPDRPGAGRGVGDRLGRVRARGDARPQRQRRDRLLDREHRPDGRPHRRLGHGRAAADALRRALPEAARPGDRPCIRAVGVETGGSNIQFAVNPADRRDRRDRDEPARVALLGARVEGDRLPDRQDRGAAGGRLRARGDRQRHHAQDAGELRADDRLRRRQVAALRVREVPRRRRRSCTPRCSRSARRWRSGARSSRRSPRRCARASSTSSRRRSTTTDELLERARDRPRTTATSCCSRRSGAARPRPRSASAPASTRGSWPRSAALARGEDPEAGLERSYKAVDTCAAEFEAETPYFYSGWERTADPRGRRGDRPSVVILGSGPNRIGQGIEFDYCCVHAAMTVRASGRDAVMINCNPETVSTDYDTSDRLYFEPLTLEDVLGVIELEQPEGVIVQFGGQTPLKLARAAGGRRRAAARHAGRVDPPRRGPPELRRHARRARPAQPAVRHGRDGRRGARGRPRRSATRCSCARRTCSAAARWRSATRRGGLADYLRRTGRSDDTGEPEVTGTIFLDRFLENAIEVDVDALCDGRDVQHRRDHAARRGGRRPLRRLGLRDPGDVARARRCCARSRRPPRRSRCGSA